MAKTSNNQTNFTAGELSPRMMGRSDVARYQNGAEKIENGIVLVHGGVLRRPGQRHLAIAKLGGTSAVRMIRYVFNVEQSYCLEFGAGYVRVFEASTGAVVLNDALDPLEIVSPYTAAQLAQITTKQSADAMFLYHPDVPTQQLRRLTPTRWILTPVNWTVQPFAEIGHTPSTRLGLSAATVGAGRTFTTSPTTVPDAPTIGVAVALKAAASVNFTPPANTGGLPITLYTATSSPGGITGTGTSSPIRVNGLTNGVAYTFTVTATNSVGTSAPSAASNSVTPLASLPDGTVTVTADAVEFLRVVPDGIAVEIEGPTATASAGTAPYAYTWSRIGGTLDIEITRANTAQVELMSENYGATNYATLRCSVVDAAGFTGSVDVNVRIRHRDNYKTYGGEV